MINMMRSQSSARPAPRGGVTSVTAYSVRACLVALLLTGCASSSTHGKLGQWEGPQLLSTSSVEAWSFRGEPARRIKSPHYVIYTTIDDADIDALLPQVMEGALAQYKKVAPGTTHSNDPMECYIFERRVEWEAFTRANTGNDASIYLQIRRGGYTVRDRFVAYYIGRYPTASVSAHEGWHQYVSRHFIGRLPPFLEEGLACMFEGIAWKNENLPRWNLSINQVRVQALRKAVETNQLWPLARVVAMHAGEVVEERGEKVDAFYAQAWCFAKFLYESENGRFRPNLQKWLAETANGTVFDPTRTHNRTGGPWNRTAVRPMLEHYLNMDFASIEKLYQAYVRRVAFEEYAAQWASPP
jgi:hypothetical protein